MRPFCLPQFLPRSSLLPFPRPQNLSHIHGKRSAGGGGERGKGVRGERQERGGGGGDHTCAINSPVPAPTRRPPFRIPCPDALPPSFLASSGPLLSPSLEPYSQVSRYTHHAHRLCLQNSLIYVHVHVCVCVCVCVCVFLSSTRSLPLSSSPSRVRHVCPSLAPLYTKIQGPLHQHSHLSLRVATQGRYA